MNARLVQCKAVAKGTGRRCRRMVLVGYGPFCSWHQGAAEYTGPPREAGPTKEERIAAARARLDPGPLPLEEDDL